MGLPGDAALRLGVLAFLVQPLRPILDHGGRRAIRAQEPIVSHAAVCRRARPRIGRCRLDDTRAQGIAFDIADRSLHGSCKTR